MKQQARRRVSPVTRERQRERMLSLSPEKLQERVQKMQEGRRKARGPEAVARVEEAMKRLGDEFKELTPGDPRRVEIIKELRPLGDRLSSLTWGAS